MYTTILLRYCPWANESVERVCREIIRACKALLSELKLAATDWPIVTECVQSALNHAPLKRLGLQDAGKPNVFRTPLQVFTCHIPIRQLLMTLPAKEAEEMRRIEEFRVRQLLNIKRTQQALSETHRHVSDLITASHKRGVEKQNQRTNIQAPSFAVCNFFLVRSASLGGHKL